MTNSDITEHGIDEINEQVQYVGFWSRLVASIIDSVLVIMLTLPILYFMYGAEYFDSDGSLQGSTDFIISYILPIPSYITFKMVISAKIVDANTGNKPTIMQYIIRYLGYYVSIFALGLGFLWVAWDDKKQGWHDKMAGTVVILNKPSP